MFTLATPHVSRHGDSRKQNRSKKTAKYLHLDDFIKEDLWILLKLKLEVLKEEIRYTSVLYFTVLYSTVFYCILLYLIVEGAVGGFLCRCLFFLISHPDENCGVDVHPNELLSLVDVHTHLHTKQRTGTERIIVSRPISEGR